MSLYNKQISCCICQYVLITSFILSISGCANVPDSNTEPMATLSTTRISVTDTPIMTHVIETNSIPPTATSPAPTIPLEHSATVQPTVALTPTQIPLPTSLPIMSAEAAGNLYEALYENNGGCQLPCWWGFEIGKASLEEIEQLYASMGANISYSSSGTSLTTQFINNPNIENGNRPRHRFYASNNILEQMKIQLFKHEPYQLSTFLQTWGPPSEVWLWTWPYEYPDEWVGYPAYLQLYFPDKGMLIRYETYTDIVNENVQICFDQIQNAKIILWDPQIWDPDGIKTFAERSGTTDEFAISDATRPIQEVTDWDVQTFYEIAKQDEPSSCLQTPSELWPDPI